MSDLVAASAISFCLVAAFGLGYIGMMLKDTAEATRDFADAMRELVDELKRRLPEDKAE